MTSPNDSGSRSHFNWVRVLRHELVHVITLQQTDFNMPHWYTEGLAVRSEDRPRPQTWNELLVRRVPAGRLFNLSSLNLAFARPESSEDWQMAYCQAELYVEYMLDGRSPDVLRKLTMAYTEDLPTAEAIHKTFAMPLEQFERGYLDYLKKVASTMPALEPGSMEDFSELVKAQRDHPEEAPRAAALAYAYLRRKADREAEMAKWALKLQPKHPWPPTSSRD